MISMRSSLRRVTTSRLLIAGPAASSAPVPLEGPVDVVKEMNHREATAAPTAAE
jgi:hypothetical protein